MLITLFILTRINLHTKMDGNIQVAPSFQTQVSSPVCSYQLSARPLGLLFWVAIDPRKLQITKSFMSSFKTFVRSPRSSGEGQMHECRRRQNAPTSHPTGCCVSHATVTSFTSRCVERGLPMRGAWKVVQMTSSLFIRITK
jgi:hypothetical protein